MNATVLIDEVGIHLIDSVIKLITVFVNKLIDSRIWGQDWRQASFENRCHCTFYI